MTPHNSLSPFCENSISHFFKNDKEPILSWGFLVRVSPEKIKEFCKHSLNPLSGTYPAQASFIGKRYARTVDLSEYRGRSG
jgi:hypothetical protein